MPAYKRSDPAKLFMDRQKILESMQQLFMKEHPDAEDPEEVLKKQGSPPVVRGGMVIGTKKQTDA